MALVWDFARQLDPAATPGSTVSYFDEMCQSFYIDTGQIKTQISSLYQGQWQDITRESEIIISDTGYGALDIEHNFNGSVFGMAQHGLDIALLIYEYMNTKVEVLDTDFEPIPDPNTIPNPNIIKKVNPYDLLARDFYSITKTLQSSHQFGGQSFNSILKDNINGQKTLTFSIPLYILDDDGYSVIENPFWEEIYNEQNIRLILNKGKSKEKVYDFVIKNYTESVLDGLPIMDVECQDAVMCELNKIALTFNTDEKADIGIIYSEFPPLNPGKHTIWINYSKIFNRWDSERWVPDPGSIYDNGILPNLYYGDQISLGKSHFLFINGNTSLWGAGYNNHGTIGAQPWLDWDSPNYIQQLNE